MNKNLFAALFFLAASAAAREAALPASGIDASFLDRSASPCGDFYQFACGGWMAKNPIPADQSRWGRMSELAEQNRAALKAILEEAAQKSAGRSQNEQKIGDYYAACLDEKAIEAKGAGPLRPLFDRVSALENKSDLAALVAFLHNAGVGALFSFGSTQDYENAERMIAGLDQGGFALPDRDYYLQDKFAPERQDYVEHVKTMFSLAGDPPEEAAREARTVLEVETALAKAAMSRVDRREPANIHHKTDLPGFERQNSAFAWPRYLAGVGAPPFASFDLSDVGFFQGLSVAVGEIPLSSWKTYLRWAILHARAGVLPTAFVQADFNFFGKRLLGQQELKARWKRCSAQVDLGLGEALGKVYVERHFGALAKKETLKMVQEIERSMREDIETSLWMTPETKKAAEKKLARVADKIGYPDKWRDYSKLEILPGDAAGNYERALAFELRRDLAKIGRPVDRGEWEMTPPTVNAYYDPQMNNINFPAGILQPPFFDARADAAANFGAIGVIVGHELTHGFDDEGRHYDGAGNLKDWWGEEDAKAFESRAQCFVDQYAAYVATADVHLNGKLTLGENTADNGGLRLSFTAFARDQAARPNLVLDSFSPEQRFFLGWAQAWCNNQTEQTTRMRAVTDPHSPPQYRVIGTLVNMPEFARAFSCAAETRMAGARACRVW